MENVDIIEGEIVGGELTRDNLANLKWQTRYEGEIAISDMADSHLRNCALMLMGMGYQVSNASQDKKIAWLTVFRMEWERRMIVRRSQGIVKSTNSKDMRT